MHFVRKMKMMERFMLRKLEIGSIVLVTVAFIGNLQGQEPDQGHPLRVFFKKETIFSTLPCFKTEMVRKELELTDEQKEKTTTLPRELYASLVKIVNEHLDSPPEQEAKMDEATAEIPKKLESILNPRQIDRLCEILTQLGGPHIFSDTDLGKNLELTDEQMEKIKEIIKDSDETMRKAMPAVTAATWEDALRKEIKERYKTIKADNEKMEKLLTPKQCDRLDKMKGKEIDLAELFKELADATEFFNFSAVSVSKRHCWIAPTTNP